MQVAKCVWVRLGWAISATLGVFYFFFEWRSRRERCRLRRRLWRILCPLLIGDMESPVGMTEKLSPFYRQAKVKSRADLTVGGHTFSMC